MSKRYHRAGSPKKAKSRAIDDRAPCGDGSQGPAGRAKAKAAKRKRGGKVAGNRPSQRADKPRRGTGTARRAPARMPEMVPAVSGRPRAFQDGGAADTPPTAQAAHVDGDGRVVIDYSDGSAQIRAGGTRSWRNNNPGNMSTGRWSTANGAIGSDGQTAIFPDPDRGAQSARNRLASPAWANETLQQAIGIWAPAGAGNDPNAYAAFVARAANVPTDARLSTLTADQLDGVVQAMTRFEGWRPGAATTVFPP